MATVTGNIIFYTKQFILSVHDKETFNKILGHLDENSREILSGSILSNEQYDIKVYQDLLAALEKELTRKELMKLANFTCDKQIKGFFGYILRFFSLERMLGNLDRIWKKTYSVGSIKAKYEKDKRLILRVSSFEFSESQLFGFMFYCQAFYERLTRKKTVCGFKKIDKETTEIRIINLAKKDQPS